MQIGAGGAFGVRRTTLKIQLSFIRTLHERSHPRGAAMKTNTVILGNYLQKNKTVSGAPERSQMVRTSVQKLKEHQCSELMKGRHGAKVPCIQPMAGDAF
jgi:hypothetical protein